MADIFISYKREDQYIAKTLANKLTDEGFSVWWDRNIPVGKAYDEVKEEALEGLKRNILIPVMIGNVNLPYGFKMIHTMLWNSDNEIDGQEFSELRYQISRLLDNPDALQKKEITPDIIKNIDQQLNHTIDDAKLKTATLYFIKPNMATSM